MKQLATIFALCTIVALNTSCQESADRIENQLNAAIEEAESMSNKDLLRHVVLFKFKEESTQEQIDEVVAAFEALPSKISEIHSYEWGTNNSPEGLNHGYEHAFLVTFLSEEDRAIYLEHPDHVAFVDILLPILEEPTVVDYWAHK